MRNPLRNAVLVATLLVACLLSIFPVQENLRLGKDLAGGVSLIYTVDVAPDDPPDTIDRTIQVLRERLDPNGLYEISMVQQGQDRIEISFPLPGDKVKALRADYEAELNDLRAFRVDPDAFERAMRQTGDQRLASLQDLIDGSEARRALLEPVIEAAARAQAAREDYELFRDSGAATQEEIDARLDAAAEAEIELDNLREQVLASIVTPERVRSALELSPESPRMRDEQTGEIVEMPSPRQRALSAIRDRISAFPGGEQALDDVIAAHAAYEAQREGFDDPNEVIRLLQGAGVLEFRIAVQAGTRADEAELRETLRERGPDAVPAEDVAWFSINSIQNWVDNVQQFRTVQEDPGAYFANRQGLVAGEHDGLYYMLLHDSPGLRMTRAEGEWGVASATQGVDQLGRPAVNFRMDPLGARLMGELTEPNQGRPMAVLLDDEVYTAPNINARLTESIQIFGSFSQTEIQYLIQTLNAGALQAKLGERPISQNTLAPSLGLDNLRKGLTASWIALVAVAVFMVFYYFSAGFVAMTALLTNAIIILGAMSLARASFTLPGIAGIVLTFGMAVDANVLIYERIREELNDGADLRTAVRLGYQKVVSTIVDANVTNLIVCVVLAYTATPEVRGFAITLGIGVIATMFSALVVTRLIFTFLLDHFRVRKMRQLPMVLPVIDRVLTPKLDFIGLRPLFLLLSAIFVGTGIAMITIQRGEMLGTEFRGGTEVTLELRDDVPMLERAEVESRIEEIVADAENTLDQNPDNDEARVLAELTTATIVPVNPEPDGVTSSKFKISTTIAEDPDTPVSEDEVFRDAVVSAFSDVIESRPPLTFQRSDVTSLDPAPVYPIIDQQLGRNIDRPDVLNDVEPFVGGVAIVIEGFSNPPSRESILQRLEYTRAQQDFSDTLARSTSLIILEGSDDEVRAAAYLVSDPGTGYFSDETQWRNEVAEREWNLVRSALTESTTLAGVQSFSAAIAQTFKAQAIVAVTISFILILVYIWIRFGSVRYSFAALVALVHDVIAAVGLIALAEILYKHFPAVAAIGIQPFKIDLGLVAAILTIIGYSLNDTIVILDRIRENRGKLAYASREVVNRSISQTVSRTIITSGTTLIALLVMFVIGGEGIASFTYALLCGVVVGTYSSIAVAAPLVFSNKIPPAAGRARSAERHPTDPTDDPARLAPA